MPPASTANPPNASHPHPYARGAKSIQHAQHPPLSSDTPRHIPSVRLSQVGGTNALVNTSTQPLPPNSSPITGMAPPPPTHMGLPPTSETRQRPLQVTITHPTNAAKRMREAGGVDEQPSKHAHLATSVMPAPNNGAVSHHPQEEVMVNGSGVHHAAATGGGGELAGARIPPSAKPSHVHLPGTSMFYQRGEIEITMSGRSTGWDMRPWNQGATPSFGPAIDREADVTPRAEAFQPLCTRPGGPNVRISSTLLAHPHPDQMDRREVVPGALDIRALAPQLAGRSMQAAPQANSQNAARRVNPHAAVPSARLPRPPQAQPAAHAVAAQVRDSLTKAAQQSCPPIRLARPPHPAQPTAPQPAPQPASTPLPVSNRTAEMSAARQPYPQSGLALPQRPAPTAEAELPAAPTLGPPNSTLLGPAAPPAPPVAARTPRFAQPSSGPAPIPAPPRHDARVAVPPTPAFHGHSHSPAVPPQQPVQAATQMTATHSSQAPHHPHAAPHGVQLMQVPQIGLHDAFQVLQDQLNLVNKQLVATSHGCVRLQKELPQSEEENNERAGQYQRLARRGDELLVRLETLGRRWIGVQAQSASRGQRVPSAPTAYDPSGKVWWSPDFLDEGWLERTYITKDLAELLGNRRMVKGGSKADRKSKLALWAQTMAAEWASRGLPPHYDPADDSRFAGLRLARLVDRWTTMRAMEASARAPAPLPPPPAHPTPSPARARRTHMMQPASNPGPGPSIYDEVKLVVAPTRRRGETGITAERGRRASVSRFGHAQSPMSTGVLPSGGVPMVPGLSFGPSPSEHTTSSQWLETPNSQMGQLPSSSPAGMPDSAHPSLLGRSPPVAVKAPATMRNVPILQSGRPDLRFDDENPDYRRRTMSFQARAPLDPMAAQCLEKAGQKLQPAPQQSHSQPAKRKAAEAELEDSTTSKRAATASSSALEFMGNHPHHHRNMAPPSHPPSHTTAPPVIDEVPMAMIAGYPGLLAEVLGGGREPDEGGHSAGERLTDQNGGGEQHDESAATDGGAAINTADDFHMSDYGSLFNEPLTTAGTSETDSLSTEALGEAGQPGEGGHSDGERLTDQNGGGEQREESAATDGDAAINTADDFHMSDYGSLFNEPLTTVDGAGETTTPEQPQAEADVLAELAALGQMPQEEFMAWLETVGHMGGAE